MVSLNSIDFLNRRCEISALIGEKKYQNIKYITEACKFIINHAFDNLNIHKVFGGTIKKEIALLCTRVLGFRKEGIKKHEIYKNGEYHDVYILGLLREDYHRKKAEVEDGYCFFCISAVSNFAKD